MEVILDLSPWRVICEWSKVEHHTMINMSTILIEKDDNVFYLYDERDKVDDVSRMPYYIKEDWINYNKKDVNLSVVDALIKEYSNFGKTYNHDDRVEDLLSELKSIRRNIQIKKIL